MWRLDVDQWPGPDRQRWHITRDLVLPSPDGRFACVLYSITEIRLHYDVGRLTLLGAPPERPSLLFQPRGLICVDFTPSPSMQWLSGSRYVAVTAYLHGGLRSRVDRLALTFLDTTAYAWAFADVSLELAGWPLVETAGEWVVTSRDGSETLRISPTQLTWNPWGRRR